VISKLRPILLNEFETELDKIAKFENNPEIGLALSGGSDSLALMCLAKKWVKKKNGKLIAFTVDHDLRRGSFKSAINVQSKANKEGVLCKILKWEHEQLSSKYMVLARVNRYNLIFHECRKIGIYHLLVAHHLDDNLETYYMRSLRGSNMIGLSSIPAVREIEGLRIIRPLLKFEKKRLIDTCIYFKAEFIQDSSNSNLNFERVRVRKYFEKKKSFFKKEIRDKIYVERKRREEIENELSLFFIKKLFFYPWGVFKIHREDLFKLNEELMIIALKKILSTNSGSFYPPKKKSVENILQIIKSEKNIVKTLHCSLIKVKNDIIYFCRESQKTQSNMHLGLTCKKNGNVLWDNRFSLASYKYNLECGCINEKNWPDLKQNKDFKNRNISFEIIKSLPFIKTELKTFHVPFLSGFEELNKKGIRFFFDPRVELVNNNF